jgi:hypothetical protein
MKQLLFRGATLYRPVSSLFVQHCYGYKTVVQRRVDPIFEEEKRVYAEEMSRMRRQHLKEYWERQT